MPKHTHGRQDSDDRHGRRDRDSGRGDRRGNDRDRHRDRSRDRNHSRDSNRYDNRSRDRYNDGSRNSGGRDDHRFPRGNNGGNNSYGFGPPGGPGFLLAHPPAPVMIPFAGHGSMGVGYPLQSPLMMGGNFPVYTGGPPMGYPPGPSQSSRRDYHEDDRSRKREREYPRGNSYQSQSRYEDDRSKRPRMNPDYQEQRRVAVSSNAPDRIFIEDVNLEPEFAFRIDTAPNFRHLKYSSLNGNNSSRYDTTYRRDDIFGASEEELNNLPFRSVFSRCVRPVGIDDHGNPVDDDGNLLDEDGKPMLLTPEEKAKMEEEALKKRPQRKHKPVSATAFFALEKPEAGPSGKISELRDKADLDPKKKQTSVRDQVEKYNVELRQDPRNVELWRKFVRYQDQVFQYEAEEFAQLPDDKKEGKKSKLKRNKKALAEKKIAILDKALESNPKDLDLHLDRLDLLYEIYKPRYVLGEWKKLVTVYQQLGAFWNEYLRFASTQLQLYSSSNVIGTFEKTFQKFRLMLNPNYPAFQKPEKFLLLIADLFLGMTFVLRDSGFIEKAIALHQAQLEMMFNFPSQLIEDQSKAEWDGIVKLFEVFWDAGTQRFGEPEAPGWAKVVQEKYEPTKTVLGIPEKKLSEWEDKFFDAVIAAKESSETPKAQHWLVAESFRTTFQWVPWREHCSDVASVEDNQRIVLSNEISPFLMSIPEQSAPGFGREAARFRSVVNFLLLLQDDFLPRTQTLDSVLSSFTTVALTESKAFFSEIYYWKVLLNLYTGGDEEIIIPEGFDVDQYSAPGAVNLPGKPVESEPISSPYPDDLVKLRETLTKENALKYLNLVRSVVEKGVENLPPKFASVLALMYIRFEERSTYSSEEPAKARMKAAKNLLQNEKLRNSIPLYGEMAILEYFCSKNKVKASDILVKAINSSAGVLRKLGELKEVSDLVRGDWETLAEITRLYRLLAEVQVGDNQSLSLNILVALGNNFADVALKTDAETCSSNEQLVARRRFEKVLAVLLPEDVGEDEKDHLNLWDGDKSVEFLVQNTNFMVEWISAFALFLYLSSNFESVSELFVRVLKQIQLASQLNKSTKFQSNVVNVSHIREQLYLMWCKIGILEVSKDPMQHGKFRQILVDALTEFPASPPLLLIFTDVEKQSSIAGKIWRHMTGVIKNECSLNSLHWAPLFMALGLARRVDQLRKDEEEGLPVFGLGGPAVPPDTIFHKLDAVLETAEQNPATRNCPLIWRIHMKLNMVRCRKSKGKVGDESVKLKFYDAIRHCPALKSLYMDAISFFPDMMKETLDLMTEKQLYVRLPVEELNVLLENEEVEEDEEDGKNPGVNDNDADGDEEEEDSDVQEILSQSEPQHDTEPQALADNNIDPVIPDPDEQKEQSMSEGEIDDDERS